MGNWIRSTDSVARNAQIARRNSRIQALDDADVTKTLAEAGHIAAKNATDITTTGMNNATSLGVQGLQNKGSMAVTNLKNASDEKTAFMQTRGDIFKQREVNKNRLTLQDKTGEQQLALQGLKGTQDIDQLNRTADINTRNRRETGAFALRQNTNSSDESLNRIANADPMSDLRFEGTTAEAKSRNPTSYLVPPTQGLDGKVSSQGKIAVLGQDGNTVNAIPIPKTNEELDYETLMANKGNEAYEAEYKRQYGTLPY